MLAGHQRVGPEEWMSQAFHSASRLLERHLRRGQTFLK